MRQFILFTLVVFSLSFNKAFSHSFVCDTLMSSPSEINAHGESDLDETDRLIAYLESLLEEGVLGDDHLSSFISGFEKDRVLNPLQGQEGSASEVQREGIQKYIDQAIGLDQKKLLKWAKQKRADRDRNRFDREKARKETQDLYQKMVFHPVNMGSVVMGTNPNKVDVQLTYSIEVMSTPVTQKHWVELMRKNPSHFSEGEDSIVVSLDTKLQPDHPVENITWWSALVFANQLSERHGLTPTYDFSDIVWSVGKTAEDGSLYAESGEVKIRHADGKTHDPYEQDVYYQAEGYRLPTDAEQTYLLKAGGVAEGYPFGEDEKKLVDYAWCLRNSGFKTHPVAQLKPLILDGREFFDLYGNVKEWAWDLWCGQPTGGRNPVGPPKNSPGSRVTRGGSYQKRAGLFNVESDQPKRGDHRVGFRLVRTINNLNGNGMP